MSSECDVSKTILFWLRLMLPISFKDTRLLDEIDENYTDFLKTEVSKTAFKMVHWKLNE